MKIVATETKNTDSSVESETESAGWFTKFSNWLKSKVSVAEDVAVMAPPPPPPPPPLPKFPFKVIIGTGAGRIKILVKEATDKEDAKNQALIDYVRRLTVSVELYKY